MNSDLPGGKYNFIEIVKAVEIFQRAGRISEIEAMCNEIGFYMEASDAAHTIMLSQELQKSIDIVRQTDPSYYASDANDGPNILARGPCPCRGRR